MTTTNEKLIAKAIFTIIFLLLYITPIVIKIIKPIFEKDYDGVNKTKEKRIKEVKARFQVFKEQLIFSLFSYFVVMLFSL